MLPPSTSSAFSSTSWLDFFVFSRTGNLVAAGVIAAIVVVVGLLMLLPRSRPGD